MDHSIFLAVNGLAGKNAILDWIGVFFADPFIYLFVAFIVILGLKKEWGWRPQVRVALLSAFISRVLIVELIKIMVARPRPFEILTVQQLVEEDIRKSFPSGHTVILFSIAFAFIGTRWFWPFLSLAVLGGLSRIFVGVHFPLDVFVAAIIGLGVSLALLRLFKNRIFS